MDNVLLMIDIFQGPLREDLTSTIPHYYISFLCFTLNLTDGVKALGTSWQFENRQNQLQG